MWILMAVIAFTVWTTTGDGGWTYDTWYEDTETDQCVPPPKETIDMCYPLGHDMSPSTRQ